MAAERLADPLREHAPPPSATAPPPARVEQLGDDALLAAAELGLALGGEELGDRHPELGLEQLVGVERLEARRSRAARAARDLPAPMKPMKTSARSLGV